MQTKAGYGRTERMVASVRPKDIVSYNMSQVKSKDTKPEKIVGKYLFSRGLRYRKNDRRYPGCPDLVFPKYKTAVFVNGCFWHMHHGCPKSSIPKTRTEYWVLKLNRNRQRDSMNREKLGELGWRVVVVWECGLKPKFKQERLEALYKEITEGQG